MRIPVKYAGSRVFEGAQELRVAANRALKICRPLSSSNDMQEAAAKRHVLIVDDEPEIRTMLARLLQSSYSVSTADGADSALRAIAERSPDLLICDVMMPGANGLDLSRVLKKSKVTQHIPILFLTARTSPMDLVDGINAGARFYMTKPFKAAELLEKVSRAIG